MLQLQFLDLVRNEEVSVPIDATAHTELVSLMARILIVVFQAKEGRRDERDSEQSQS